MRLSSADAFAWGAHLEQTVWARGIGREDHQLVYGGQAGASRTWRHGAPDNQGLGQVRSARVSSHDEHARKLFIGDGVEHRLLDALQGHAAVLGGNGLPAAVAVGRVHGHGQRRHCAGDHDHDGRRHQQFCQRQTGAARPAGELRLSGKS